MTDKLNLAEREVPSMELFNQLREQAAALIQTGFLPAHLKTAEQVVAVILIGRELGVPMMQALRKIYVIQGTPALASELMLALAERTGELEDLRIEDDGAACTVTIKRRRRKSPVVTRFSMADAAALGLASKGNWKQQAPTMRQWRAISANLRLSFPDATGGMYPPEEIAPDLHVNERGEPVGQLVSPAAELEDLMPRRIGEPTPLAVAPSATPTSVAPEGVTRSVVETATDEVDDLLRFTLGLPAPAPDPPADTMPTPPLPPGALRFHINGVEHTTAGITKLQFIDAVKLGARVDTLCGPGTFRDILGRECGVEHRNELTEAGARLYLAALAKVANAAIKAKQR